MANDPEGVRAMGEAATKSAERFTWDRFAREAADLVVAAAGLAVPHRS